MAQAVLWLREIEAEDIREVGEKAAQLGTLVHSGISVPDGFAIPSSLYFRFLKHHSLTTKITHLLETVSFNDPTSLLQVSSHIKRLIIEAPIPEEDRAIIYSSYRTLGGSLEDAYVAVRPSTISEAITKMVFTGHPETFLNIRGETTLVIKIKEIWASLFDPRAIYYRHEKHIDHFHLGIGIIVQRMIQAEASGTMVTIDPTTHEKSRVTIEALFGLGESNDSEVTISDSYVVNIQSLAIETKVIAEQNYSTERVGDKNKLISVDPSQKNKQKITDEQITVLATLGKKIETLFYFPQEITWAISNGSIAILQARPFTPVLPEDPPISPLILGNPGVSGVTYGKIALIQHPKDAAKIERGEIVVISELTNATLPELKKASGVIAEKAADPATLHAVSVKLGVPTITGVKNALQVLKPKTIVSINGRKGAVYSGSPLPPISPDKRVFTGKKLSTATKLYVMPTSSDSAAQIAELPIDGIGMLDGGAQIVEIGIHPKKMIRERKEREYEARLAEKIARFCGPFSPRPVLYRLSDLSSDAYKKLSSGKSFEPEETNPLLGYHGAVRFLHDPEVFTLEVKAVTLVRNTYDLKNLWLILPSVRTAKELTEVKKMLTQYDYIRSGSNRVFLEISVPANVILIEEFINVGIDGLVINADQLTTLLLGIDPENSEVTHRFNPEHPAVLQALYYVITTAHKHDLPISIFGQHLALSPDLIEKLIDWGVSGICVPSYALENTRKTIYNYERKLIA